MGLRTTISRVFSSLLKGVTALGAKAVTGPIKDVSGAAKDVTGIRKDLVETKLAQYEVEKHESLIQKATLKDVETYDNNLRHLLEAVSKLDTHVHDFPYPRPSRPPLPLGKLLVAIAVITAALVMVALFFGGPHVGGVFNWLFKGLLALCAALGVVGLWLWVSSSKAVAEPPRRQMDEATRQRISEMMKLRWAERKAEPDKANSTAWELSFERVQSECKAAEQLMYLCAFLAPEDIPRTMLQSGAKELPEPLRTAILDDLGWQEMVGTLRRYSLIQVSDEAFSIPRLDQKGVRDLLKEAEKAAVKAATSDSIEVAATHVAELRSWPLLAVKVVDSEFPFHCDDVGLWPEIARRVPHALAAAEYGEGDEVAHGNTAVLLGKVGDYFEKRGEFAAAKSALERGLRLAETAYGPNSGLVGAFLGNLSGLMKDSGDVTGARQYAERSLRIVEVVYGPDHSMVAKACQRLGGALYETGDLDEARECLERALKIDETNGGPDDVRLSCDLDTLGLVLFAMGDLTSARQKIERSLEIDLKAYGPDDLRVASRMSNLAAVCNKCGDPLNARKLAERALAIEEGAFGTNHPNVAIDHTNLAGILYESGDRPGALIHFNRALEIFEHTLGEDHPRTQQARENLDRLLAC